MKQRSKLFGAVVAVAAMALTACGSSDAPAASSPAAPAGTSSAAAATGSADASSAAGSSSEGSAAAGSSSADSSAAGSSAAGGASSGGPIKIGSANFPESVLLGEIYASALEAKGITVERKLNLGNRELYMPALLDGSIDLLPEYSGVLLDYFDKAATVVSSEDIYAALPAALPAGYVVLDQSTAEDKDAVVVTAATAAKYNLKSIADLAAVAGDLVFGGPPEIESRKSGLVGLKDVYGVEFGTFSALDAGGPLTKGALENDQIDAGDVFTTDPDIASKGWVVLEDPKFVFAAQNILPLANKDKVTPEVEKTLNAVSGKLTTDVLIQLLTKVYAGTSEADAGKAWVTEVGLG